MQIRLRHKSPLQALKIALQFVQAAAQPQPQIRSHLIIATAAGVQFLANRSQQRNQTPLNGEMNVFISESRLKRSRMGLAPNRL